MHNQYSAIAVAEDAQIVIVLDYVGERGGVHVASTLSSGLNWVLSDEC